MAKDLDEQVDKLEAAVDPNTVIAVGGFKFTPAKLMVAGTIVSTIIGGLFGGHKDKWDEVVNLFEDYTQKIISEDKGLPHEEHVMSLMYVNHRDLFERKHFDIWWCRDNAPAGVTDELFEQNKSFYKILEEFNRIYE